LENRKNKLADIYIYVGVSVGMDYNRGMGWSSGVTRWVGVTSCWTACI